MRLQQLNMRLLEVFRTVVDCGSVSAAARQLHLTQPTVSLQLKKIQQLVGTPLVDFQQGQLQLTNAGQLFYSSCQSIHTELQQFAQTLRLHEAGHAGQVSIGLVNTAKYWMPPLLSEYAKAFPQVSVNLHIGNRAYILERFAQGLDDLYMFSHPPSGDQVKADPILKNPLQIIAPSRHWAAGMDTLDFQQLRHERFLLREPGSATRMSLDSWLSRHGIELPHSMQIESNEAIRSCVAANLGIAVLSAHTQQQVQDGTVVLNVRDFPLLSHWYLVQRRDKRLSPAAARFVEMLYRELPNTVPSSLLAAPLAARA
jgi:DNA-binding transcriptional LysR family regulator